MKEEREGEGEGGAEGSLAGLEVAAMLNLIQQGEEEEGGEVEEEEEEEDSLTGLGGEEEIQISMTSKASRLRLATLAASREGAQL